MNICFITARILDNPQRIFREDNYITLMKISFPYKRKLLCYAKCIAYNRIGQNIFDLYFKGDYIIIEGKLVIAKNNGIKGLLININNIHPAHIIMQK
uniref:putative single-stranded DNA binding protein n=1 Tax=Synarthrophyton patena TaxID=48972 RepID=UPI002181FB71|nr:putative single-stranded DNA binding protein [Synarthrophyton patena]UVF62964.1 putative single-stranded DNA binding protein [Synarthrophyton patena]